MNIIKYRAWNCYKNKMYSWEELGELDAGGHLSLWNVLNDFVEHTKPLQHTPIKDKNGKSVCDGDIVHYLYQPGKGFYNADCKAVIKWEGTGFYMEPISGYGISSWLCSVPGMSLKQNPNKHLEVIGNIYENPEMLNDI